MKDLGKELTREPVEMGQGKFDLVLQSFRRLLRRGAITNVGKMLARMHPADVAQVIVHLSSSNEKRTVFELVRGEAQRGQVLSELDPGTIQHTLADLAPADVAWTHVLIGFEARSNLKKTVNCPIKSSSTAHFGRNRAKLHDFRTTQGLTKPVRTWA